MSIQSAFSEICKDAKIANSVFVSLYRSDPFYGGPEEGGWWGSDVSLVASQEFASEELAEKAKEKIEKLSKELSDNARREYGEVCNRQIEWCEARGIDDPNLVFGEVDGESRFYVHVEHEQGENESRGCRHYE